MAVPEKCPDALPERRLSGELTYHSRNVRRVPLFALGPEGVKPFRCLNSNVDVYERDIERDYGEPLADDPTRLAAVVAVGVEETTSGDRRRPRGLPAH